jgi:hypothetical protein
LAAIQRRPEKKLQAQEMTEADVVAHPGILPRLDPAGVGFNDMTQALEIPISSLREVAL